MVKWNRIEILNVIYPFEWIHFQKLFYFNPYLQCAVGMHAHSQNNRKGNETTKSRNGRKDQPEAIVKSARVRLNRRRCIWCIFLRIETIIRRIIIIITFIYAYIFISFYCIPYLYYHRVLFYVVYGSAAKQRRRHQQHDHVTQYTHKQNTHLNLLHVLLWTSATQVGTTFIHTRSHAHTNHLCSARE